MTMTAYYRYPYKSHSSPDWAGSRKCSVALAVTSQAAASPGMFRCVGSSQHRAEDSDSNREQPKHKRRYKFRVHLRLKELEGVTLSNGVLFAKVRLLNGGSFCHFTERKEIRDNRVTWQSDESEPITFVCRMSAPAHTGVLNPCELRISVRKEEKGGRSYSKVGYAIIDLANYGYCSSSTDLKCILNPYSQRVDNSTLRLSLKLETVEGDPIFRPTAPQASRESDSIVELNSSRGSPAEAEAAASPTREASNLQTPIALSAPARAHCRNPSGYSAASIRTHSRNSSIDQDNLGFANPGQSSSGCAFDSGNLPSSLERKRNGNSAVGRGELNSRIINTRSDNYQIVMELFKKEGIGFGEEEKEKEGLDSQASSSSR